jgi:hypothetical protein
MSGSGFIKLKPFKEQLSSLTGSAQEKATSWLKGRETSSKSTASEDDHFRRALVAGHDKNFTQRIIARYIDQGYRLLAKTKDPKTESG